MERFQKLVALTHPKSTVSEAYRTLRTNLQFINPDEKTSTILVTSSALAEGKSGTVANLGVSLAQNGQSVVLVDADLRKPGLRTYFDIPKGQGLTNVLAGQISYEEVLCDTQIENLKVLTTGPLPANPSEILGSKAMDRLLAELREKYDYVLIDTPPCLPVADASVLSSKVDGVVLVVATNETHRQMAVQAKDQLTKVGAKILGVVMTKVEIGGRYGYYYYYDYGVRSEEDAS